MKAHLEARQSADLKKDLAKKVMPSDGPYTKGEKVLFGIQMIIRKRVKVYG